MVNSNETVMKRTGRALLIFCLFLIGLFLLVNIGLLFVGTISSEKLEAINQFNTSLNFYMQFVRWGLYLALLFYWEPIIIRVGQFRQWEQYVMDRALASHKTVMIVLIVVELFAIQSLHTTLFNIWR
tara:strand:+ start:239 stop:619 length:381 start_codon:yes stop_codon:yes gene_type:complete